MGRPPNVVLYVGAGKYEENITLRMPDTYFELVGTGSDTIIQGVPRGTVVITVRATNAHIRGFQINLLETDNENTGIMISSATVLTANIDIYSYKSGTTPQGIGIDVRDAIHRTGSSAAYMGNVYDCDCAVRATHCALSQAVYLGETSNNSEGSNYVPGATTLSK